MRNKHRIPIIIEYLINNWLSKTLAKKFQKKWEENYDQRLFQLASNYFTEKEANKIKKAVSKIDNYKKYGDYWDFEEENLIKWPDLPWTVRTDENGELLNKPKHKQLKDLSEDHLRAILNTQALPDRYFKEICKLINLKPADIKMLEEVQQRIREERMERQKRMILAILRNNE